MTAYEEVQGMIVSIYDDRNRALGEAFLQEGLIASATRLTRAFRRQQITDSMVYDDVARMAARTFALAALLDFDLMEVVGHKWPDCCSHCHFSPCKCLSHCEEKAIPPPLSVYSIDNVQDMLHTVYGSVNAWRGVEKTLLHLFEEIGELNEAMRRNRGGIPREVADVFAQVCALASHRNLRVEGAVVDRYRSGCPKCEVPICRCPLRD